MSHNSTGVVLPIEEAGQSPLPFRLSGSQGKTAYALEKNVARMIEEAGLERCGFLTLTVGEVVMCAERCEGCRRRQLFVQVWDAAEASRRINSLMTHVLRDLFPRAVVVTERHKSGAIHFHLVVECAEDIRGGFDFAAFLRARTARRDGACDLAAEREYGDSATAHLRSLWGILRERLPGFGFGRAELTPIFKTGEAVSRYVAKYVEKNLFNRLPEDKGKKLVRYMGWRKSQLRPNDFSWCTPRAIAWRNKARQLCALVGVSEKEAAAEALGPRWAFKVTRIMHAVDDSPTPEGMIWVTRPSGFSLGYRDAARSLMCQQWDRWAQWQRTAAWVDQWRDDFLAEQLAEDMAARKPRAPVDHQRLFKLN